MKKREGKSRIDRRQALRRLVAGAGASAALPVLGQGATSHDASAHAGAEAQGAALGSALPPDPALSAKDWKPRFFDEHQNSTVVVLSDLIIPDTDTPGARAAQVNRFIDRFLCASSTEVQERYLQALGWLDGCCIARYAKPFTELAHDQKVEVLTLLTHPNPDPRIAPGVSLFRIIKDSIAHAYYTSEIGALQELKYETNSFQPGFPGCANPDEHN